MYSTGGPQLFLAFAARNKHMVWRPWLQALVAVLGGLGRLRNASSDPLSPLQLSHFARQHLVQLDPLSCAPLTCTS